VVVFVGGKELVSIGGGAVSSRCMSTLFQTEGNKKRKYRKKMERNRDSERTESLRS
jgi:hypothetical protein